MRIQECREHPEFPSTPASQIKGCWEFDIAPGEGTIPHQHAEIEEIHVVLEGEALITVGSKSRTVGPGELVCVPAGKRHTVRNNGPTRLRGLTIEQKIGLTPLIGEEEPTVRDLEDLVEAIPEELDVATSLQAIIQLFDLAGCLSEKIDASLGLDNEVGYAALRDIEHRVMDAVVEISHRYQLGGPFPGSRRF